MALLVVALMYPNPFAQIPEGKGMTVPVGLKFGPMMGDFEGKLSGSFSFKIPLYVVPVLGQIIQQPEIGYVFADLPFESQTLELNSWRIAEVRQFGLHPAKPETGQIQLIMLGMIRLRGLKHLLEMALYIASMLS